ncbi:MAG: prolyl oligopeptidase family serine peptidase, partial [Acidimicrobiia bacterium]
PQGESAVPLLLNIHGGPASQYGFGFFDEFQVYAGAGYGVVACNPRGSAGRGEQFVKAVKGENWGTVDHVDVTAAVTAALERHQRLDADRMGIMGGSYGGFLTAWIIGQEQRWKSAVVERGLLSWTSFAGTSDIGGVFPENYLEEGYPTGWERWWEKSPLALAHRVTTPTLIIHAEEDFRCPIEQAEQYLMALLRNGIEAELLRFPGEGHEMSRSGKPRHRKERFEAILDWHSRHLMEDMPPI